MWSFDLVELFKGKVVLYELYIFSGRQKWVLTVHTAKKKGRKFKANIPRKGYRGLSPNFHIHVSVSQLYIPTMELPFLLEEICGPILGKYKSLTDTWMWKLGLRPRYSYKRNIETELPLQCSICADNFQKKICGFLVHKIKEVGIYKLAFIIPCPGKEF